MSRRIRDNTGSPNIRGASFVRIDALWSSLISPGQSATGADQMTLLDSMHHLSFGLNASFFKNEVRPLHSWKREEGRAANKQQMANVVDALMELQVKESSFTSEATDTAGSQEFFYSGYRFGWRGLQQEIAKSNNLGFLIHSFEDILESVTMRIRDTNDDLNANRHRTDFYSDSQKQLLAHLIVDLLDGELFNRIQDVAGQKTKATDVSDLTVNRVLYNLAQIPDRRILLQWITSPGETGEPDKEVASCMQKGAKRLFEKTDDERFMIDLALKITDRDAMYGLNNPEIQGPFASISEQEEKIKILKRKHSNIKVRSIEEVNAARSEIKEALDAIRANSSIIKDHFALEIKHHGIPGSPGERSQIIKTKLGNKYDAVTDSKGVAEICAEILKKIEKEKRDLALKTSVNGKSVNSIPLQALIGFEAARESDARKFFGGAGQDTALGTGEAEESVLELLPSSQHNRARKDACDERAQERNTELAIRFAKEITLLNILTPRPFIQLVRQAKKNRRIKGEGTAVVQKDERKKRRGIGEDGTFYPAQIGNGRIETKDMEADLLLLPKELADIIEDPLFIRPMKFASNLIWYSVEFMRDVVDQGRVRGVPGLIVDLSRCFDYPEDIQGSEFRQKMQEDLRNIALEVTEFAGLAGERSFDQQIGIARLLNFGNHLIPDRTHWELDDVKVEARTAFGEALIDMYLNLNLAHSTRLAVIQSLKLAGMNWPEGELRLLYDKFTIAGKKDPSHFLNGHILQLSLALGQADAALISNPNATKARGFINPIAPYIVGELNKLILIYPELAGATRQYASVVAAVRQDIAPWVRLKNILEKSGMPGSISEGEMGFVNSLLKMFNYDGIRRSTNTGFARNESDVQDESGEYGRSESITTRSLTTRRENFTIITDDQRKFLLDLVANGENYGYLEQIAEVIAVIGNEEGRREFMDEVGKSISEELFRGALAHVPDLQDPLRGIETIINDTVQGVAKTFETAPLLKVSIDGFETAIKANLAILDGYPTQAEIEPLRETITTGMANLDTSLNNLFGRLGIKKEDLLGKSGTEIMTELMQAAGFNINADRLLGGAGNMSSPFMFGMMSPLMGGSFTVSQGVIPSSSQAPPDAREAMEARRNFAKHMSEIGDVMFERLTRQAEMIAKLEEVFERLHLAGPSARINAFAAIKSFKAAQVNSMAEGMLGLVDETLKLQKAVNEMRIERITDLRLLVVQLQQIGVNIRILKQIFSKGFPNFPALVVGMPDIERLFSLSTAEEQKKIPQNAGSTTIEKK